MFHVVRKISYGTGMIVLKAEYLSISRKTLKISKEMESYAKNQHIFELSQLCHILVTHHISYSSIFLYLTLREEQKVVGERKINGM